MLHETDSQPETCNNSKINTFFFVFYACEEIGENAIIRRKVSKMAQYHSASSQLQCRKQTMISDREHERLPFKFNVYTEICDFITELITLISSSSISWIGCCFSGTLSSSRRFPRLASWLVQLSHI